MRVFLALMFAFAAGAAAAQTPPPLTTAYETSWSPPDRRHDAEAVAWFMSGMKFEGEFKIWYLLGEPVVNCTARWTNSTGGSVSLRADDGVMTETAGDGEVEVYNLLLTAAWPDPRDTSYGVGSARTIAVPCDAGVVAQNGRSGFNVAGSPSWDKFLCALPDAGVRLNHADDDVCRAMGGKWLDAASAKEVARKGLIISNRGGRALGPAERAHDNVSVSVLKGEVSGMAVMKRVEKRLWREKSAAFKLERSKAYFTDFPSRPGEGAAERTARRNDAMRRMPDLPRINPSTEQLAAYEQTWRAILAETPASPDQEKEWRAKEKALVGEQLKRLKQRDSAAAREEKRILRAFTDLQARKKNEPKQIDPMAEYRAATLIPFEVGNNAGLKRPDGSIAVAAQHFHRRPRQYVDGFGIYIADSRPYYVGNSRHDDGPCGSTRCVIYYDNDGRILYKKPGEIDDNEFQCRDKHYGKILIKFGLICERINIGSELYSGDALIYSFVEQRKIIPNVRQAFPGSFYRVNTSAYPVIRNGRMALALTAHIYPSYTESPYDRFTYFYLDDESFEGSITSTPYYADPLNTKVE